MKVKNAIPPYLPGRILGWLCKGDLLEEILGDLHEYYREDLKDHSRWKRNLFYWFHMMNFMRPFALKSLEGTRRLNYFGLAKNYSKTSLRSLLRHPINFFINLSGLSAAIGVCVVAYAFIQYASRIDQFHEHKDDVYLTTFFANREGAIQQNGMTPAPLGKMLREDFSQIIKVCRVDDKSLVIKYGRNVFDESVRFVDPEFLEMLTFPLKWGVSGSLRDVNSIVLSENMAQKYFGQENPIGEHIQMILPKGESKAFKITGVAGKFPASRSFSFDFLVNFENLKLIPQSKKVEDWDRFIRATFVQVNETADLELLSQQMEKYKVRQEGSWGDWNIESFAFQQLTTLHEHSAEIRSDISSDSYTVLYYSSISFTIIGFLMLFLAASNYINIAIVSATHRLKEIGLRKVIGANRRMVVIQFLLENMLVMSFALSLGFVLAIFVFIPWMEYSNQFAMDFTLTDRYLWVFLPAVLLFTALVSGIYPALYISKFQVASIFKGSLKLNNKNVLTKVFLGFQLALACVVISIAVLFAQNTNYQNTRGWGYDPDNLVYARVETSPAFEQLRNTIAQNPNVLSVSGGQHHVGRNHATVMLNWETQQYEARMLSVQENYITTLGLDIKEGRTFKDNYESDRKSILINETLVKELDMGEPVGRQLEVDDQHYNVIGVIRDFHAYSFSSAVRPTVFRMTDDTLYRYVALKVRTGTAIQTNEALQETWATLFPEIPYSGGLQSDVWGGYHEEMDSNSRFWKALALLVVIIASLGLYGLVTLNVSGRSKEFSIRKVLGASIKHLTQIISSRYIVVFALALLVGIPVSYMLVKMIFETFYIYHMPLTFSFVWYSGGVLFAILCMVVMSQITKVSSGNPSDGLRVE